MGPQQVPKRGRCAEDSRRHLGCEGACAPKGGRTSSEAQEGCWGWKSTLTSLAKSQSHEHGRAPGSPGQDPEKPHCVGEWRRLHRTPEEARGRRRNGHRSAIQGAGVVSPVGCCRDPVRGEKGSLDLHRKTTGNPASERTDSGANGGGGATSSG